MARTDLTDLEDGGTIHTIATGVARELDDVNFQMTNVQEIWDIDSAMGLDLDRRGEDYNPDKVVRRFAAKAVGSVVFSRTGTSGIATIPTGAIARVPDGGPAFVTTAAGTIPDLGSSSGSVAIQAVVAGVAGNVDGSTITQMDGVTGVETVTNSAATTGGQDRESDADFRTRMKAYLRSLPRGTVDALKFAALTATLTAIGSVRFAEVVELGGSGLGRTNIYADDGAGTISVTNSNYGSPETVVASAAGGEVRLFLDSKPVVESPAVNIRINAVLQVEGTDYELNRPRGQITLDATVYPTGLTALDVVTAEYTWYEGLIAETQMIIDGDASDRANYPGYRAAGTDVFVLPPTVLQQVVTATVAIEEEFVGQAADILVAVRAAINRYINNLGINGDVILSELIAAAQSVQGVFDVQFTAPTANVTIGEAEIARVTDANINLT